jgi:hypothetical protein
LAASIAELLTYYTLHHILCGLSANSGHGFIHLCLHAAYLARLDPRSRYIRFSLHERLAQLGLAGQGATRRRFSYPGIYGYRLSWSCMPIMPTLSLNDLQQQISQRERELQALRRELEARQNQLMTLTSRKEELLGQLRQVEAEIATLAASAPNQAAVPPKRAAAAPATPPAGAVSQPKLADLIVTMLRQSGQALTSRQLQEEAVRRGYQSKSRNLIKTIKARLQDLKSRGIVRRAADQPGYILARSREGAKARPAKKPPQPGPGLTKKSTAQTAQPAKSASATKKASRPGATRSRATATTKPLRRGSQPPLREVLTNLLKKSSKLLSGSELAEQALAAGYRSNSPKFVDVVWAMLSRMDNVEHVPEKGYRLKKT